MQWNGRLGEQAAYQSFQDQWHTGEGGGHVCSAGGGKAAGGRVLDSVWRVPVCLCKAEDRGWQAAKGKHSYHNMFAVIFDKETKLCKEIALHQLQWSTYYVLLIEKWSLLGTLWTCLSAQVLHGNSVGLSVRHFVTDWNISKTVGWVAIKFNILMSTIAGGWILKTFVNLWHFI